MPVIEHGRCNRDNASDMFLDRQRVATSPRQCQVGKKVGFVSRYLGWVTGGAKFGDEFALPVRLEKTKQRLAAGLFLNKQVGWRRWCSMAAGFVGVAMVMRPDAAAIFGAMLIVLSGAYLVLRTHEVHLFQPKE